MPQTFEALLTAPPLLLIAFGALGGVVILGTAVILLARKLRRFMRGASGASLEETLLSIAARVTESERFQNQMEEYLLTVEDRLRKSVRGVEMIRFTPFKDRDTGGQSFATCFLNENGDGLILSSLYVRDRTNVYAKPVKNGSPVFEASEEEREALNRAKAALTRK